MRAQRNMLLLIVAAAFAVTSAGAAFAQKINSRGPSMGPAPSGPSGFNRYRGPGLSVPGIILAVPTMVPPDGPYIDDGSDRPPRPRQQRATRRGPSGAPPAGERRLVPNEVLIEVANSVSAQQLNALQRRLRLTRLDSQRIELTGSTLVRWRIPDRRSVATVVREFERDAVVASAQPNYLFTLQEETTKSVGEGDPAQYALAKLHLPEAHALVKGDDVRVAVIDSAIDPQNGELAGSIAASFDALSAPMAPHEHGTAIAGLIAAHGTLMGAAPNAKILAVRAFDPKADSAQGTTFNILKGLDWAASNGARIINMSFTGPADPAMQRSLEAAHKKGIVLIAAAGNAGAKSPPLYPAAYPMVIAVSATDAGDKLFEQSNRGRHIAIAAPGADILVATPDGPKMLSGTSFSAPEVSGVAALLLQRDPALTPDKVRKILQSTAKDLGPKGRDDQFGYGLVDALAALSATREPVALTTPPQRASGTR